MYITITIIIYYPGWHILFSVAGGPVEVSVSHGESVRLFVRVSVAAGNTTDQFSLLLSLSSILPQLPLVRFVPGAGVEVYPGHVPVWLSGVQSCLAFFVPADH